MGAVRGTAGFEEMAELFLGHDERRAVEGFEFGTWCLCEVVSEFAGGRSGVK